MISVFYRINTSLYTYRYMDYLNQQTRTMFCRVCHQPVEVNTNYQIHEVTCRDCYSKEINEHHLINDQLITFAMKPEQFEHNSPSMRYEYHRVREGPNYFVSYYNYSSRLHYDPKNCWRTLGVAKFTDTGKALKEWCLNMDEQYGTVVADGASEASGELSKYVATQGFGPEAHEEPNDNTKMIT